MIERTPLKTLTEGSYTLDDLPDNFYAVLDLGRNKKSWETLAKMRLEGVTGVSQNGKIEGEFLVGRRDVVLIMPARDFVKANKVTRILYDNPNYMLSKNAWALRRVLSVSGFNDKLAARAVFMHLLSYVFRSMKQRSKHRDVVHTNDRTTLHQALANVIADRGMKVDGLKSAAKVVKTACKLLADKRRNSDNHTAKTLDDMSDWPTSLWEKWLSAGIKAMAKTYQAEGEWVIKGDVLNIPRGSKLRFLVPDASDKVFDEYVSKLLGQINKHKLNSKYDIEFVSSKDVERARKRGGKYKPPAGFRIEG